MSSSTTTTAPVTEAVRAGSFRRRSPYIRGILFAVAGIVLVAVAWQLYAIASAPPPGRRVAFPTLTDTLGSLGELLVDPGFWRLVGFSMRAWIIGLVVSTVIAIPVGMWLGLSRTAYRYARLPIELIRPIPAIIILPLVIVLMGTGVNFQVILIMQGVIWPLLIQTAYGVHLAHDTLIDTAKSLRLTRWRTIAFFRFPAAAPQIATGLKVGAAAAFAVTVTTEYVGGSFGIGTGLLAALSREDVPATYAITLFTGIVGITMILVFSAIERYFARWAPGGER
ncbi:ABC transporter permease [Microbacterium sp.]|uniref:ABC transporter permease n=1 Tax=Microbacterium sp. TaxID=51671 RepID=UPI003A89E159